MITDADLAAKSIGMKVGNTLVFNDLPAALGREPDSVVRYMLGVKENPEAVATSFRAELTGIKRQIPAEVNQEFLDKVFGQGAVSSEEEARGIIRTELGRVYNQRTDRTFNDKLVEHLLDNTEIPLPEDFLKKWLRTQKEEGETLVEEDFVFFRRNLKWSLIYNKVAADNGLSVSREEIESAVRADVRRHYGAAFESLDEDDLNGLVGRLLQDKEYLEKVHSGILDARVFNVMHQAVTISDEPVSLKDYEKSLKAEELAEESAGADASEE
jgi:trigger factor